MLRFNGANATLWLIDVEPTTSGYHVYFNTHKYLLVGSVNGWFCFVFIGFVDNKKTQTHPLTVRDSDQSVDRYKHTLVNQPLKAPSFFSL